MQPTRFIFVALAGLFLSTGNAAAQSYPSRPITLIVPYPPAGTTDISARIVATKLGQLLGQTVVVENRPGAAGAVGTAAAAKAPAGGYTLVTMVESSHAVNPSVRKHPTYHPVKDFSPISNIMNVPNVLIVSPKVPATSVAELVALLKANPDKFTYGSSGYGGQSNMNGELFKYVTGTKALHIPYNGMGQALIDIVGGQVDFGIDNLPSSLTLIQSGKIRALAVASPKRVSSLPDVPTFGELGMPEMNQPAWFGLGAPAGVDEKILNVLNKAMKETLADDDVIRAIDLVGGVPAYTSRDEFKKLVESSFANWNRVIDEAHIERIE